MNAQRIKDEPALASTQPVTHINEISTQLKPDSFIHNQPIRTKNNSSNNKLHRTQTTSAATRTNTISGAQQMFQATRSNSNNQPLPCVSNDGNHQLFYWSTIKAQKRNERLQTIYQ